METDVIDVTVLSWDEFLLKPSQKRGQLKAYCSSVICTKRRHNCQGLGVEVEAHPKDDFCKRCGSALFWSRHVGVYKKNGFKGVQSIKKARRWA